LLHSPDFLLAYILPWSERHFDEHWPDTLAPHPVHARCDRIIEALSDRNARSLSHGCDVDSIWIERADQLVDPNDLATFSRGHVVRTTILILIIVIAANIHGFIQ
jgi:hypothetical protein